jgi:Na+/glutamate symporter
MSLTAFDLNLLETMVAATALFFIGHFIVRRSDFLQRYSTPVPVVGMAAAATAGGAGVQAARLSKDRALVGITIPMHPAAARYFRKRDSESR